MQLGQCAMMGIGMKKNPQKAVEYYTEGSSLLNDDSLSFLGECILGGTGIDKEEMADTEEYLKNFYKGVVPIVYGDFYENNEYIRDSKIKAFACYKRAMGMEFGAENFFRMKCAVLEEQFSKPRI